MDGDGQQLGHDAKVIRYGLELLLSIFVVINAAHAQELHKYRGADGDWIYSDRPAEDGEAAEKRTLQRSNSKPEVLVTHQVHGRVVGLTASNQFYASVELTLNIQNIVGPEYPDSDKELSWLLPPRSDTTLVSLNSLEDALAPYIEFQLTYLPGDPSAVHRPTEAYRVRPGQRVSRGEYIANSGNTGYSSRTHLHFAVVRNKGMRIESLPVEFQRANAISPATGALLTAY
jgi:hypothetical protein